MRTTQAAAATAMLGLALLAAPAFAREPATVQEAVGYADAVIAGDTVYL